MRWFARESTYGPCGPRWVPCWPFTCFTPWLGDFCRWCLGWISHPQCEYVFPPFSWVKLPPPPLVDRIVRPRLVRTCRPPLLIAPMTVRRCRYSTGRGSGTPFPVIHDQFPFLFSMSKAPFYSLMLVIDVRFASRLYPPFIFLSLRLVYPHPVLKICPLIPIGEIARGDTAGVRLVARVVRFVLSGREI